MADKNSFLLYTDYYEQIELLNIEQRGILLTAIMAYQLDNELPDMDAITKMCFSFISADMRRNNEKYAEVIEKRREAGRKGGKKTQANQANAYFAQANKNGAQANQANQADNVNVNDNDNVNDSVNVSVNDNEPQLSGGPDTHIPTFDEIALFCNQHNIKTDIKKFMQYNEGKGWSMEWTSALALWVQKDKDKKKEDRSKNRFNNFENSEPYDFEAIEQAALQRYMSGDSS